MDWNAGMKLVDERKESMEHYGIALAFIGGLFITTQGAINGMVGHKVGIYPTIVVPVAIQIVILTGVLLIGKDFLEQLKDLKEIEYGYMFLMFSSFLGLGVMFFMTYSIMRAGPLIAFSVAIFSQLFCSMIFEHFGTLGMTQHPITLKRIAALGLMLLAVKLFME